MHQGLAILFLHRRLQDINWIDFFFDIRKKSPRMRGDFYLILLII